VQRFADLFTADQRMSEDLPSHLNWALPIKILAIKMGQHSTAQFLVENMPVPDNANVKSLHMSTRVNGRWCQPPKKVNHRPIGLFLLFSLFALTWAISTNYSSKSKISYNCLNPFYGYIVSKSF
jgi:hypothetical protein